MATTSTNPTGGMSATDRRALAKIIDQRFAALQRDFDARREQVARDIREQAITAAKSRCAEAEARLAPLVAKAQALREEIDAEVRKISRELDVFPGEYYERTDYVGPRHETAIRTLSTREGEPVTLTVKNKWAPANLESQIHSELEQLGDARLQGSRSLDVLRIDLQEKLLIGGLNGDAAAFLEQIPTLDALLPQPAQLETPPTGKRGRARA